LAQAQCVIGNDSGPMHLATAVGTRTVSIFGPVDAGVYGPAIVDPNHRVVTRGIACQPCYRHFKFPPCPWDNSCLKALPVETVLETLNR
jgi:heptosyltransferase-1